MVQSLWVFLRNTPETAVPYPWERCFDIRTEVLFYKNLMNGSMVIDLRSRVNLGGGLFHFSNMWHDLTGRYCSYHYPFALENQYDQDPPFLIAASCCGPLVYFLCPEMVSFCPICNCQVYYIG
ncbi:uncharacterized protein LOC8285281 [Ricinus communis]|uniref:Uncharacterized protein n=1 Tax=Ricinus communis TaxID=3988 RepID=B9RH12_RICCO|nr:uncharacterized protein LOC8285281 [Ricinus communis]EEF49374.1 conserved hypothetical protein [Ricinus communis]|eukprot:XP_002512871.1 uncharacterized protein LOC8285281 [Ricinus communis]